MKRLVLASLEDEGGDRCVDLLQLGADFGWVECRRDPEDGHGWRHLHPPRMGFADRAAAQADAAETVGWVQLPTLETQGRLTQSRVCRTLRRDGGAVRDG